LWIPFEELKKNVRATHRVHAAFPRVPKRILNQCSECFMRSADCGAQRELARLYNLHREVHLILVAATGAF
jgi:hypothetical protein